MLEISSDGLKLLRIFAQNTDGNSRWAEADFAQIYGQSSPNIETTIDELLAAELIQTAADPVGRRKTDLYEITEAGSAFILESA